MLKTYYALTKPGIIYGNAVTAAGGFFLASKWYPHLGLFLAMFFGISLVMASGCVFNNYMDRDIDHLMARTKKRALVSGEISVRNALIFASVLGLIGTLLLALYTNFLTVGLALAGWFAYVILYGIGKRRSVYGTLVGSISGAVPPVVGYCAVTGTFDAGAVLLFVLLVLWQMPHFYAIAMYRLNDYASASIPVLPVEKGMQVTKIHMLGYVLAFLCVTPFLNLLGYAGLVYLVIMTILGLVWLGCAIQGFRKDTKDAVWARKMFRISLVVITAFSLLIALNPLQ